MHVCVVQPVVWISWYGDTGEINSLREGLGAIATVPSS
jgi:hypothetical protein